MRRGLMIGLMVVSTGAAAQFQQPIPQPPHPSTLTPPAQPPVNIGPPPVPAPSVNLKTGEMQERKLCEREAFYPCPDERMRNCVRKEVVPCN